MEKNKETTMEQKVKQKINIALRSTYLKLLCSDYHLMEACLWGFYFSEWIGLIFKFKVHFDCVLFS